MATLYFFGGSDLDNLSYWWTDSGHTLQASAIPTAGDYAYLDAQPTTGTIDCDGVYDNTSTVGIGGGTYNCPVEIYGRFDGGTFNDTASVNGEYKTATFNGRVQFNPGALYVTGGSLTFADRVTFDGINDLYSPNSSAVADPSDVLDTATNLGVAGTLDSDTVLEASGGTYHAPDASEVIDTAVFGPNSGTAGTFDLDLYVLITDVVAAEFVAVGHDNYVGGEAGTFVGEGVTLETIAEAVWSALTVENAVVGSFGKAVADVLAFGAPPTAAVIADAVLDESLAAHTDPGTLGLAVGVLPSAEDIADTVLDEVLEGHDTSGTLGAVISDIDVVVNDQAAIALTATEISQIRYRLGIDGTTAVPADNAPHLLDEVIDTYATGTFGDYMVTIHDAFAAFPTSLMSPARLGTGDTIELYRGIDYTEDFGGILFESGEWIDLTGMTVTMDLRTVDEKIPVDTLTAAAVLTPGEALQGIRFDLAQADIAALPGYQLEYLMKATNGTNHVTLLWTGLMQIND